jgi:superfamily I DNA/RNA helicase
MYLEESKSIFLTVEEKMDIYHIFEEYEVYKAYHRYYDRMDVVNHILQEMMFGRYRDESLDHIFIDEVQDLTPATIFLITKLASKNIFYCGDTAQAISKGVTFRFSEIKSLFSKSYFKHCI